MSLSSCISVSIFINIFAPDYTVCSLSYVLVYLCSQYLLVFESTALLITLTFVSLLLVPDVSFNVYGLHLSLVSYSLKMYYDIMRLPCINLYVANFYFFHNIKAKMYSNFLS